MSMLDVHSVAVECINEAYHNFLLQYKRSDNIIYGIVEGKDDPIIYRSAVERFIPDDWRVAFIIGGNKKKVLEFIEFIDWTKFNKKRIALFVDRDLSTFTSEEIIEEENIFITDGYSIENYIVNSNVFVSILNDVYNVIDATDDELNDIKQKFDRELSSFQNLMSSIMGQILGWRRDNIRCNLNNIDIGAMFQFEAPDSVTLKPEFCSVESRIEYLSNNCGAPMYPIEVVNGLTKEFVDAGGVSNFTRGKYLLWFLLFYLQNIHRNLPSFVSAYSHPPRVRISIGHPNIVVVAAPRVRVPASLRAFIERTFLAYINDGNSPDTSWPVCCP